MNADAELQRETMEPQTIVGIGTKEAQDAFLANNKPFLDEYHQLLPVIKTVFLNRTISPPADELIKSVEGLPDDHPNVLAIDDKYKSDLIVYTLGRIVLDDFGELIVLAGNGWGIGALKILRGMYERCVTAAYIAKTPAASRAFADSIWIHKAKVWKRLVQLNPKLGEGKTPPEVKTIQDEAKRAQDLKNESVCKHCGQLKKIDAWTALDLASMARIAGKQIEDLYLPCYLEPTAHMHATGAGTEARMVHTDDAWTYKIDTSGEAQRALLLGHNLILQDLRTQNDYFALGLFEALNPRFTAFNKVWDRTEISDEPSDAAPAKPQIK